jgi:hypothetical protein
VGDILKYLFPVPKPDSKRVVTFSNEDDRLVFRHHTFEKAGKEVVLKVRKDTPCPFAHTTVGGKAGFLMVQGCCASIICHCAGGGSSLRHEAVPDQAGDH